MMKKRSFFDRLAGAMPVSDDYDAFEDDARRAPSQRPTYEPETAYPASHDEDQEGQLPVDVYQTAGEIVVRTFIAGVRAEEINLSISRDMVVIDGARPERDSLDESAYVTRELFWGAFSRTIMLPVEVDVDSSSATAKDGLLTLILPKLDKAKQTKLKVKVG
jgi:HSP20 family protein